MAIDATIKWSQRAAEQATEYTAVDESICATLCTAHVAAVVTSIDATKHTAERAAE